MHSRPPSHRLKTHSRACAAACLTLLAFMLGSHMNFSSAASGERRSVELGIEHSAPLALDIDMSTRDGKSIVDISHGAEEMIFVSVPDLWERREVRGSTLDAVVSDGTTFSYRRWHLPAGASVSFRVPYIIESMELHDPSETPVKVTLTRVDLNEDTVEHDVILVHDSPKELW